MSQYILDIYIDGVQSTMSLTKIPTSLVLKLRRIDTTTTETLVAEKVVL